MIACRGMVRAARPLLLGAVVALAAMVVPAQAAPSADTYPPLVIWQTGAGFNPPFTDNFNPCSGYQIDGGTATGLIYEPLMLGDGVKFVLRPWLATSYHWSNDLKTLTFTIRHGVRWSDGVPFTAQDVYFTFTTLAKRGCDQAGLWGKTGAAISVTMPAPDQVAIHLKKVDTTFLYQMVGSSVAVTLIYPQHIFAHVKNPSSWIQKDPVGTGPFTQIRNFTPQSYDQDRNPYYWRPCCHFNLRIVGFTSTDAGNLAMEAGQADWAGTSLPNAKKTYEARNPHFHAFYPYGWGDLALFPNDTKYPYSSPVFRKALSMALNRHATGLVQAEGNPLPPSNPNAAAADPWPTWVDKQLPNTYTQYNPAAARTMLQQAGFNWRGGHLIDPHGKRVSMTFLPPPWDLAGGDVMARNFREFGIDVDIITLQAGPFGDRFSKGQFDVVDGYAYFSGPTPYFWYDPILDGRYLAPLGVVPPSGENLERWSNPRMDKLLAAYRQTADVQKQHALVDQMQQLFVQYYPVIPLYPQGIPETYNDTNYTAFPTAQNDYAAGQADAFWADTLVVLTHLRRTH